MNVVITNRQRAKKIDARLLKEIVAGLFAELKIEEAEIGINLVGAREMALVNETFLQHEGSTDVITFDHRDSKSKIQNPKSEIYGELFICIDDAMVQAREFGTSWQAEITRYIVHGVLHLLGYDDLKPHLRRKMKHQENRLMRRIADKFTLAQIAMRPKISA
ncbi:MAG TPA: rRNA maturation RNase YbeY [Candidatus Sulfotelmatobacter sp.]|nr:rRNA maturation RNase YbeY [Candidatus Sulfotelmatobacter sp.]